MRGTWLLFKSELLLTLHITVYRAKHLVAIGTGTHDQSKWKAKRGHILVSKDKANVKTTGRLFHYLPLPLPLPLPGDPN